MMYWYGPGMGGWGYLLMALSMLLFWGLGVAAVVVLVRYLGPSRRGRRAQRSAGRREEGQWR